MKKSIINHYDELVKKYGENHKGLGWLNGRQAIRFEIINSIGNFNGCNILDVGCGFGDFYKFLKYKKIKCQYLGVDINSKFIDIARDRYPDAKFQVRDLLENKIKNKFDWVIATGITNHSSSYQYIKEMLTEMLKISKKGVSMDFISSYVEYKQKEIFYSNPEKIFKIAKLLSSRVTIRHDYMPYEFSIYIYKNDRKNEKNIFNEYFNNLSEPIKNESWSQKII